MVASPIVATDNHGAVRLGSKGRLTAGTVAWTAQDWLHLTVVAKATFTLVPGGPMTLAAPAPIARADAHDLGNPMRRVRSGSVGPIRHCANDRGATAITRASAR